MVALIHVLLKYIFQKWRGLDLYVHKVSVNSTDSKVELIGRRAVNLCIYL